MTSGPTQFPQGPQLPGQKAPSAEPNARLIGVPNELREVRVPLRLPGEVAQVNKDGSVRVDTPRGTVDIILPRGETPQQGERVEIIIPPGRPPKQAVVRQAPEANRETPRTPPTGSAPQVRPSTDAPQTPRAEGQRPSRPVQTPVDIRLTQPLPPAPSSVAPLRPQDVVQILPLAPNLQEQIIVPPPEAIAQETLQRAAFVAQIVVIDIQAEVTAQILQTVRPAPPTPQTVPAQEQLVFIPEQSQPVLQPPALQAAISLPEPVKQLQNLVQFFPALNNPLPAPVFTPQTEIRASILASWPQPQALSVLPAALFTPQSGNPAPVLGLPQAPIVLTNLAQPILQQPLTATIESIAPPPVRLVPPGLPVPQTPAQIVKQFTDSEATKVVQIPNIQAEIPIKPIHNHAPAVSTPALVTGFIENLPVLSFFTPDGEIIQNFVLQTPAQNLVPGMSVQITPLAGQPAIISAPGITPSVPLPLSFLSPEPWPVMQQIYSALSQIAPQAAQAMASVTPNAASPAQMGPAALFFLAAVRAGDMSGWLGDKTLDALRREGRGNLISRLTQEGNSLLRLGAEPVSQDWRGMSLPLYWQGEIHKMALYYKRDRDGQNDEENKGGQTRFIFDLRLSNMGKVQLDGLMRGKKLDLIVRTEQGFSQGAQMEMRRIYTSALEQTQLSGELSFQSRPEQWVTIEPDTKESWSASI